MATEVAAVENRSKFDPVTALLRKLGHHSAVACGYIDLLIDLSVAVRNSINLHSAYIYGLLI